MYRASWFCYGVRFGCGRPGFDPRPRQTKDVKMDPLLWLSHHCRSNEKHDLLFQPRPCLVYNPIAVTQPGMTESRPGRQHSPGWPWLWWHQGLRVPRGTRPGNAAHRKRLSKTGENGQHQQRMPLHMDSWSLARSSQTQTLSDVIFLRN